MGLDWTIGLRGEDAPERAMGDTDVETVRKEELIPSASSPPEHFEVSPYEQSWYFRAQRVTTIDAVPDRVKADLYRDMAPPQMEKLASSLNRVLENRTVELSETNRDTIQAAIEWLQYWADAGFWIFASW